jgi:hypothetical protein
MCFSLMSPIISLDFIMCINSATIMATCYRQLFFWVSRSEAMPRIRVHMLPVMFDQWSWRNFKAIDNYYITVKIHDNHTDRFPLHRQMRYIDACFITVRIYTVVGTIKYMWHLPSLASLLVCCPNQSHNNFSSSYIAVVIVLLLVGWHTISFNITEYFNWVSIHLVL